ncbi:MAG TPA: Uma2 family endonuclease [Streptosporangiaceae bacterium]|jgi:Uma2 family endonuclease
MSAVSIAEAWPSAGHPFTVEELDRMPDDGHRYELLDGSLAVSPRPGTPHQVVAGELFHVLRMACPAELRVVPEPAVQLSADTEFAPDIVVVRADQIGGLKFTRPPLLVVEVRSPSTALIDLNRKKSACERFGVPSYWIVVPDSAAPQLIACELRDGCYTEAGQATGDATFAAARPFPVEVVPARLVAGLPT